ncbi:hypothetical protein O988_07040 [Pseudogymnoascus sp. VKM F-3808]|nr:hypothetical protein O988_07040 [Pseudogymnoascus sp. VKM F-3808]
MFVWYSHSIRVQTSSPHLGGWCIVGNSPQVPSPKSQVSSPNTLPPSTLSSDVGQTPGAKAPPYLLRPSPSRQPYAQPNMPWAASPAAAANTTTTTTTAAGAGISSAGMRPASRSKLSWVDMNRAG